MNTQKRNKIIVLGSCALFLFIALTMKLYVRYNHLTLEQTNIYKNLQSQCPIFIGQTFSLCRYNNNKIEPVQFSLLRNQSEFQPAYYIVKAGDKIIVNLDLSNILTGENYRDINKDLNYKLSLCLLSSIDLSNFRIYSKNNFQMINSQVLCFSSFYKNWNSPKIILEGFIPEPKLNKSPFAIDVYVLPSNFNSEGLINNTTDKLKFNEGNFLIKIIPCHIIKEH